MDHLQVLRLPTMAKFNAGFLQCNRSFEQECVGPSKANYEHRMMKVWPNFYLFHLRSAFSLVIKCLLEHLDSTMK